MLPKIQALAVEGITVECRKSTETYLNRLTFPGQFEMICYKAGDDSLFVDSNGIFNWNNIHEYDLHAHLLWNNTDFMSMETSFNLDTFELWILSDRCNPNHHCGDVWKFSEIL